MKLKNVLIVFLLLFIVGCSHKVNVETIESQKLQLSQLHQKIFLEVSNSTNEKINLQYDLNKALEQKAFVIVNNKEEASLYIKLNIVYAGLIDKRSSVSDIMKDININIGVGGSSGNVSIYTTIGSTIGRLLGEKMDSTLFQMVVDIQVIERNKEDKNTQLIITAPMNGFEKEKVIYHIEEEIVKRTAKILE